MVCVCERERVWGAFEGRGCSIPLYVDGFWILQISLLIRMSNRGEQQQPTAITKTRRSPYGDLQEQLSHVVSYIFTMQRPTVPVLIQIVEFNCLKYCVMFTFNLQE